MKEISTNGRKIVLVEVSSTAFGFDIQNYTSKQELIYMIDLDDLEVDECKGDETLITIDLPLAKDYKILGTIHQEKIDFDVKPFVTEMNGFTTTLRPVYKRYDQRKDEFGFTFYDTPQESFLSLLKSNNIDTTKKWVCIEVKKLKL